MSTKEQSIRIPWERKDQRTYHLCPEAEPRLLASMAAQAAVLVRFVPSQFEIQDPSYPYTLPMKFIGVPAALTLATLELPSGEEIPPQTWILPDEASTSRIAEDFDSGVVRHSHVNKGGSLTVLRPNYFETTYAESRLKVEIDNYLKTAADADPQSLVLGRYAGKPAWVTRAEFRDYHADTLLRHGN